MENKHINQELVDFATYFADNYKNLDAGIYHSSLGTYKLIYSLESDKSCAAKMTNIYGSQELIRMNPNEIKAERFTRDVVFYMVILFGIYFRYPNAMEADLATMKYVLEYKRMNHLDILYCVYSPFKSPSARFDTITNYIKIYKNEKKD